MKLTFNVENRQPDPFIFEDDGKFYMYVTATDGVDAYSADNIFGEWRFEGIVASVENGKSYWAPSIIRLDNKYYLYFSCSVNQSTQMMHVMSSDSPLGPFENPKRLYDYFSIDSHTVKTDAGLFLWFSRDGMVGDRIGTRICIDRLLDPYTPEYKVHDVIFATLDEEQFTPKYRPDFPWHTIEGAFWIREGDWQYVMYSGGCYQNDTYHVGYAAAKTDETDLTKINFIKRENGEKFAPVLIKNEFEEGTGHHSVIKHNGEYYAIYHARDYRDESAPCKGDRRTARICKLHVKNGIITAERYEDRV